MHYTLKLMRRASIAAVLAATIAPVISGQQSTVRPPIDRVLTMRAREFNNMVLEKELRNIATPEEERLALAQIREDYLRIQMANNDMVQAVSKGVISDLKIVAKSASEIRKRAARLKYNLALPGSEEKPKRSEIGDGAEAEQLQSSLLTLCGLVDAFVNNPLFQQVNVVDAQWSVKARRDLDQIIVLSEHVKKRSEKLDRAARKSS
ncbi:MAG: hypothetical protein WCD76_22460 [Pyrinomonadaceae bacterium]